jgi:hypothetical protein
MTSSATAIAFSAAMLAGVPFGAILWRKHNVRMREEDQKLRDVQLARLQSLQVRMKNEFVPPGYLDLPSVRLAGLLAASRDEPSETH